MTPEKLYDAWIQSKCCHSVTNERGWVFELGKFRDDKYVRMFIKFDKDTVKKDTGAYITTDPQMFDSYFYRGKPFWCYSKLDFIDFDDCHIDSLSEFLNWCAFHSPIEVLELHSP